MFKALILFLICLPTVVNAQQNCVNGVCYPPGYSQTQYGYFDRDALNSARASYATQNQMPGYSTYYPTQSSYNVPNMPGDKPGYSTYYPTQSSYNVPDFPQQNQWRSYRAVPSDIDRYQPFYGNQQQTYSTPQQTITYGTPTYSTTVIDQPVCPPNTWNTCQPNTVVRTRYRVVPPPVYRPQGGFQIGVGW